MKDTMECKNCTTTMYYKHSYQCYECPNCSKVYNDLGQELRPIEDWREEYDEEYY